MRSTSARRELVFVLALAAAGLAVVLAVAFTPWYPVSDVAVGKGNPARVATREP